HHPGDVGIDGVYAHVGEQRVEGSSAGVYKRSVLVKVDYASFSSHFQHIPHRIGVAARYLHSTLRDVQCAGAAAGYKGKIYILKRITKVVMIKPHGLAGAHRIHPELYREISRHDLLRRAGARVVHTVRA